VSGERGARRTGDHTLFDELAVGWALQALEPEDEALFVLHLPDCARCARTVSETSEVMAALATDLPAAEPSAELRERLHTAVDRTEQVRLPASDESHDLDDLDDFDESVAEPAPTPAPAPAPARRASGFPHYEHPRPGSRPAQPPWRRRLPSVLVAAAVAAILGLGTWNVTLNEARTSAETAAAQQSDVVNKLLQPGQAAIARLSDNGGHEVATVVARQGSVQVVTDGLAVNDTSRFVYVVWGMRDNTVAALGTFDVLRSQMDLRTVGSDQTGLDGYPAYAISLERGRQAPRIPSDVVAQGQVTS
jgi:anti-sigma-K factor RskA